MLLLLLSRASRKRTKDEGRNCLTKEEEEEEEEEDVFNPALPPCVPKVNPVVVLIDNRRGLIFVCFCFLFVFCEEKQKKNSSARFAHTTLISGKLFPLQKKKATNKFHGTKRVLTTRILR
jgi:hypothetical protein